MPCHPAASSARLSIPSFMLCERSPARIDRLRESRYGHTSSRIEVAMEDRLLYRVPEVALILNISRSKVYELLGSGDLPSVRIDRTRLVRGSDLRQYVESLRPVA